MLLSRRRQRFVGRAAEIELFRACLDAESPAFAVLYVHGPGVSGSPGCSTPSPSRPTGRRCASSGSMRAISCPLPKSVRAGIDRALGGSPALVLMSRVETVVLLDSYERLAALDDWIREHLLPDLPQGQRIAATQKPVTD